MYNGEELWNWVEGAKRIGIAGHIRPDGDCIGTCLALYNYILRNFSCETDIYLEEIPESFRILKNVDDVNSLYPDAAPYDLFIAVDCGDFERLGKAGRYLKEAKLSLCLDHHDTNTGYAMKNRIVPTAAAAAEALFDLMDPELIDINIAEALYLAIVHDTGVFKHSNTTRHTMEVAGRLLEYGVSSSKIIDGTFYEKTYLQNQILGRCLMESIVALDGKVIFSSVNRKVQALYGLESSDTEGVIDQLRVTKGVEVAILLKEMNPQVWRVSMRSCTSVNVGEICMKFGGGGHIRAAGCIMNGSMHDVINALLREIEQRL
ncbi:MAG: bifunctional oligoribonuclease/PAP phosphatase NrnA [Lachnospiraceae bacterium]|nr:bifunctional oligoribonuclease/PAP phosphatase NrnA [Lachnospiraceae bacterium]